MDREQWGLGFSPTEDAEVKPWIFSTRKLYMTEAWEADIRRLFFVELVPLFGGC